MSVPHVSIIFVQRFLGRACEDLVHIFKSGAFKRHEPGMDGEDLFSGLPASVPRCRPGRSARRPATAPDEQSLPFVAPMTTTSLSSSRPSISVSIWLSTLSMTCESLDVPRAGARASTVKEDNRWRDLPAFLNISRTARSLSPTHFDGNPGTRTGIKFAPLSLATAFAIRVFPVPGGP